MFLKQKTVFWKHKFEGGKSKFENRKLDLKMKLKITDNNCSWRNHIKIVIIVSLTVSIFACHHHHWIIIIISLFSLMNKWSNGFNAVLVMKLYLMKSIMKCNQMGNETFSMKWIIWWMKWMLTTNNMKILKHENVFYVEQT